MVGSGRTDAVASLALDTAAGRARLLELASENAVDRPGRAATRVLALPGDEARLHVRRALHGGWLAPLWRGGRAGVGRVRAELLVTERLRARGAPVPEPVLGVAERSGLLWQVALATVHIEGAVDALTFLRAGPSETALVMAAEAAGRAVRTFHEAGGRHRDLHLGNLLVRECDPAFESFVIDLDAARAGSPAGPRRRRHELMRLERSVRKRGLSAQVGAAGRDAFLRGYAHEANEDGSPRSNRG